MSPTGRQRIVNPSATVARGIRRRGERAISRKTIAQGRPGVPAHLAVTRVHFCAHDCGVSWAPGFPCALASHEGIADRTASGAPRREIAMSYPALAASIEHNSSRKGEPTSSEPTLPCLRRAIGRMYRALDRVQTVILQAISWQ